MKYTLEKNTHRINDRLPEEKMIKSNQLSEYRNGIKSPPPEVRELMIELMGEDAGVVYPWEELVVIPQREENRSLKAQIYDLTNARIQYMKTAIPAFLAFFFLVGCICLFATSRQVWRPLLETMANRKVVIEKYEDKITDLEDRIEWHKGNDRAHLNFKEDVFSDYAERIERYNKRLEDCEMEKLEVNIKTRDRQ